MFQELPWYEEACFTRILLHQPEKKPYFHKPDVFHTVSLGIGKTFAASSLAILQRLLDGTSIESRISEMSSAYLEFCRESRPMGCFILWGVSFQFLVWVTLSGFLSFEPVLAHLIRNTIRRRMSRRLTGFLVVCTNVYFPTSNQERFGDEWGIVCAIFHLKP